MRYTVIARCIVPGCRCDDARTGVLLDQTEDGKEAEDAVKQGRQEWPADYKVSVEIRSDADGERY